MAPPPHFDTVVFDLGAVVLSWAPHRPYEQVLPAPDVPAFMAAIDFPSWNRAHDAGQPYEVGERRLIERFPEAAEAVRAYREHFGHSLTGMVPGTGAVIAELQRAGVRLLALTNWSAETFPHARRRFGLLDRFEDIVVSGEELLAKPDPAIFELLLRRHSVDAARCVFVDDSPANVAAAAATGITALEFTGADRLRGELAELGLLGERGRIEEHVFHLTQRDLWRVAQRSGEFGWSSRDLSYEQQGYVHCSYATQVAGVAGFRYADVDPGEVVVLELDLSAGVTPVVEEEGEPGVWFPHLFAPLPLGEVTAVHDLPAFLQR